MKKQTNLEFLEKQIKLQKITNIISNILFIPFILLIGITAPKSKIIATIFLILSITDFIIMSTSKKKKSILIEQYNQVLVIKQGIEDSKEI